MHRYHEDCAESAEQGRPENICPDCWEEAAYMLNFTTDAAGIADYIARHATETIPAGAS